jgi:hypothetical protein
MRMQHVYVSMVNPRVSHVILPNLEGFSAQNFVEVVNCMISIYKVPYILICAILTPATNLSGSICMRGLDLFDS